MFKKMSLSRDYLMFSIVALVVVITVAITTVYNAHNANRIDNLYKSETSAARIEAAINNFADNTNRIATYIGKQIAENGSDDLHFIHQAFKRAAIASPEKSLFSWSHFDWVDARGFQLVNSRNGVLKNPADMNHRQYVRKCAEKPWTFQVSTPAVGFPSGQWVIPAGTGVTDKNGKYLGAIIVGINIALLTEHLELITSENRTSFIIIDDQRNIVAQSVDHTNSLDSSYFSKALEKNTFSGNSKGEVSLEDESGEIHYYAYRKVSEQPYIILTGKNEAFLTSQLQTEIVPKFIQFGVLITFLLVLLYFFRRYILAPVSALAKTAQQISEGKKLTKIPRSPTIETNYLAKQIIKIMRYMNLEERRKEELRSAKEKAEDAQKIAVESIKAKENFVRKVRHELRTPLNVILGYSEIMAQEHFGELPERYKEVCNLIHESGLELLNFTRGILNVVKIDPLELINESIVIQKDAALRRNVTIENRSTKKLPPIWGDYVRLQQALVGTLHQSLQYTGKEHKISVKAHKKKGDEKTPPLLVIKIQDNGFGFSEKAREDTLNLFDPDGFSRHSDGTDLTIPHIRKIIELHGGSYSVSTDFKKGTCFEILLPLGKNPGPLNEKLPSDGNVVKLFK